MVTLFVIILGLLLLGGIGSLLLKKDDYAAHMISSITSVLASLCALGFSADILATKIHLSTTIPTPFPFFTLSFRIDALSAFFIGIIALIALTTSIYGIGYMKHYYGKYSLGTFGFFYNLFLLSLFLVVTAHNGFYFLFVWELMSLTSLFLVLFEYKEPTTIHAGLVYFVMTHIATACIFVAFLLLYQYCGSFDFSVLQAHALHIPYMIKTLVLLLFLVGFGTKAGIVPFHIWLPKAHSAAPSHVSALMSGVMIKMGIFMYFRMFLDILPQPTLWLGILILLIGAASSVLGVLYALSEHDSKRLLAYHSIENIGIILLGLGSGLIFIALNLPALASIAIIAGLFHTLNHAVFKSLLFLGAGSVISQTHTRNMEEYGG